VFYIKLTTLSFSIHVILLSYRSSKYM